MTNPFPAVTVGIVSWNTSELLDRCLSALPAALGALVAEVVVVDNASSDDSVAVASRQPGVVVVVNPENRGYARAMNQALSAGSAPVLIALNPDTEPPPESLSELVAFLQAHADAAVCVPRLVYPDGALQHSVYRFPSLAVAAVVSFVPPRWQKGWVGRRWWLEGFAPHDRSGPVDWGIGAVHVIRRAALSGRPPYSERWFMYVEDLELCWRLTREGWTVWLDAEITIPHVGNAAGAQAWGDVRELRWLEATYDFYGQAHSRTAARCWAGLNTVAVLTHLVVLEMGSLAADPAGSRRRSQQHRLRSVLRTHVRALVRGPPPPRPAPLGHNRRRTEVVRVPPVRSAAVTDASIERAPSAGELQAQVDAHPFWYHSIDIAPGVVTPGWFDLRPIVNQMPWPNVRGKRCLDIGTFDGYLAFELERRGAAEVVAVDVEDHLLWDWPADYRDTDLPRDPAFTGPPKGAGFRLAAELLESQVDWRPISIYDLDPDELGTFDVVVCGTLLLHLRDPIRALEAVRRVTRGVFLSSEQIELWLSVLARGRPLYTLNGSGGSCQWFNFNAAGHRRLLYAAGFDVERVSRPYAVRFNHHPKPRPTLRNRANSLGARAVTGSWEPGILHRALLGRPRV